MGKGNGGGGSSGGGTSFTVKGTRGDDNLSLPSGALITQVTIDGGTGSDTLNLSSYGSGVTLKLEGGFAKSKSVVSDRDFTGLYPNYLIVDDTSVTGTIRGIENVIGTSYNDYLFAQILGTPKYLDGGDGNDVLHSIGGNATLVGGAGCDWLVGYWENVTLVGGTYAGGVAEGDGQTDYFYTGSQNPLILDFEIGIDKLICEFASTSAETGTWVSNGAGGSTLMVNDLAEVTLADIGIELAQTIEIGYALLSASGDLEGSAGDDLLFVGMIAPTRIHLGADNGDDATIGFDILSDVLVFEDDVVPTWSDTLVNGAPALLGTWAGGSITLQGLDTQDVDNLLIEGVATAPAIGAAGPGPWSTDADFASTALLAG